MAKKKAKSVVEKTPIADAPPAPKPEEKKKVPLPESGNEGVARVEKETPMDNVSEEPRARAEGKWIAANAQQLAQYEADGVLHGYDNEYGEVLIKEK